MRAAARRAHAAARAGDWILLRGPRHGGTAETCHGYVVSIFIIFLFLILYDSKQADSFIYGKIQPSIIDNIYVNGM